ncbi:MAG: ribosomal-processing cysteine protease Prp, partial [Dialister micraerophilus]|nr:ribosomal-processing cysteine protease Prp [Dialister micraerophilus]
AIVLTTALGLRDVLKINGQFDSDIGILKVDLNKKSTKESEIIIQTMLEGLREISRQYPGRIKLIESRG